MHDLFTPADRAAVNATMASSSGTRFQELLLAKPKPSIWLRVGIGFGGFMVALFVGGILVAALGLVGLIALIVLVAAALFLSGRIARWLHRRSVKATADREIVGGYASQRGWTMVQEIPLMATTPLLRQGDRRKTGWGVTGTLSADLGFAVGAYVYEIDREVSSTDADGGTSTRTETTSFPFTIALVATVLPDLQRVAISKGSSGGLFSKLRGTFSDLRPVPLESAEFNDEYRLMVADEADELAIRMRFTPAVIVALLERGAGESQVEAEGGVLLVARAGIAAADDFGELLDVLGDAVWFRALLADEPAGRVPDTAKLRTLLLGPAA